MVKLLRFFFMILFVLIIIVALSVALVLGYFFTGEARVQSEITWGVDFSQSYAEYLGLDWKQAYLDIIDDLGAKNIKLHTQWDFVEEKMGNYFFDDIDWQIRKAEEKNVKIIFVVGLKTGRWPECHMPGWAQRLPENLQKAELLKYVFEVIGKYKDSKAIVYWQVENEPFLRFGMCPAWYYKNNGSLQAEVNLVKALDSSRQIIISESGEQSMWFEAAKIGDIVGITMYRNTWGRFTDTFGMNAYSFLNPVAYFKKTDVIKRLFNKQVVCIELQSEPWTSKPILEASLQEQSKSMNVSMFKENIEFAKKTGLSQFYFWGSEWWYWMKEKQNQPEIWEEAKNLFKS